MGSIVVNALGAYGLAATDASDVSDVLTVAANNSNQSVDDLGESLKYVGPVARTTDRASETRPGLQQPANAGTRGHRPAPPSGRS